MMDTSNSSDNQPGEIERKTIFDYDWDNKNKKINFKRSSSSDNNKKKMLNQ